MDDLRQEASDTQRQLAEYQRAHNIVGTDENSNLTMQTLENVSGNLDDAEADRIMKEARMRDFNSLNPDMVALTGDDPAIAALHTQLNDLQTQRAQMATKYGPKHPQMQQIDLQIEQSSGANQQGSRAGTAPGAAMNTKVRCRSKSGCASVWRRRKMQPTA